MLLSSNIHHPPAGHNHKIGRGEFEGGGEFQPRPKFLCIVADLRQFRQCFGHLRQFQDLPRKAQGREHFWALALKDCDMSALC